MNVTGEALAATPVEAAATRGHSRRIFVALVLLSIAIIYVVSIVRIHPTYLFGLTEDDGIYLSSAKALAEGKGYILPVHQITVSPIDVTTSSGLASLTTGLAAGAPVKVYGVPQADGTLKAYVLTYFTGQAPAQ